MAQLHPTAVHPRGQLSIPRPRGTSDATAHQPVGLLLPNLQLRTRQVKASQRRAVSTTISGMPSRKLVLSYPLIRSGPARSLSPTRHTKFVVSIHGMWWVGSIKRDSARAANPNRPRSICRRRNDRSARGSILDLMPRADLFSVILLLIAIAPPLARRAED